VFDSFYIAWKYVLFNKFKSVILVTCITLIAFLPLSLELLLKESEKQLMVRAVSTPLLAGAKGSALDLVMNTLYFDDEIPELINMGEVNYVHETQLAVPIPIYVRFKARGYPVVGTTLDYFDYRKLKIASGGFLTLVGESVLGATVAEQLGLKPGDSLISSPENLFDLAGVYPLKLKVAGILEKSNTADDRAIFVDLKTTWIIQGLGHGHEDLSKTRDPTVILERTDTNVAANAKLDHYNEITKDNIDSFHFHGDLGAYPITAVIAVPFETKSETLLRGRYLTRQASIQILKPKEVIDGLLENIFKIKSVMDGVILLVGSATVLAIILVFALSLRIRKREIATVFKLGCRRMTITRLMAAEICIIVLTSAVFCGGMVSFVDYFSNDLVRTLIIR